MDPKLELGTIPQHFLKSSISVGVGGSGTAVTKFYNELWCHNNRAQPNLTYNVGATYHTTYNIHTYHHLHRKAMFA